jgi:hypothetical protein
VTASWITALLALFSGIGGWWFTNFLFHPWKEVQELRRKSRFEITYWLHSSRNTPIPGADAFRKLAFELLALNETSPVWFRTILQSTSYNLTEAADGMIGLSHVSDGDFVYRAICRHRVEKGLLLKMEFSEEQFERIYKRWAEHEFDEDDDYVGPDDPVEELFIASNYP